MYHYQSTVMHCSFGDVYFSGGLAMNYLLMMVILPQFITILIKLDSAALLMTDPQAPSILVIFFANVWTT